MANSSTYQAIIALGAKMDKTFGPAFQSANKMVSSFGKGLATVGKTAAVGVGALGVASAAAGAAAIKLGTTVVQQFGELEQNLGGSEAVFGRYAAKIQKTGEDAYKNLGVSQSDYLATANKMGALFQGSGVEQQKSLELTEKAMQRAADMASVMGIDMQVALDSVAGAAKGNFTMMDNLGVAMNATNIEAYALAKGLNFTWKTASQAEKAEVAMQMFFDNTGQYAGNFARESTQTITGSLGLLKAAVGSFTAGLGNANADMSNLTGNVVEAFNSVVSNVVPIFKNIASALPTAFEAIVPAIDDLLPTFLSTVTELATQVIDMSVKLLPKLIPVAVKAIMTISRALIDNLPLLVKAAAELGRQLISSIADSLPGLKPILGALQNLFGDLFGGLKVSDVKSTFITVANTASQLLVPAINLAKNAINIIVGVFQQVAPIIAPIIGKVAALAQKFMEMANVVLPVLAPLFTAVFGAWMDAVMPVVDGLITALGGLMDFITGVFTLNWSQAWQGIQDIFGGIFSGLAGLIKAPLSQVIGLINRAFAGIGNITIPDWVPIVGGKSFSLPQIPMLYTGVRNFAGGVAMVGERGPEIVRLPRGSDVYSNSETRSMLSTPQDFTDGLGDIILKVVNNIYGPITQEQAEDAAELSEAALERMLARIKAKRRRKAFAG